jgi:hypothetical protein
MLQNLSKEIRECHFHAEECKRRADTAMTPAAKTDFLEMERRWLSLAHSYEFTERLSNFTEPFRKANSRMRRRPQLAPKTPSGSEGTSGALHTFSWVEPLQTTRRKI